jgi:hypothetical protein
MMSDPDVLRELRTITKLLLLANSAQIERELGKIASTEDKKRMWVLIDGNRMLNDSGRDGNVSERAVNYFLGAGVAADVIEYSRGKPPRRSLDYVPAQWIELVRLPESEGGEPVRSDQTTIDTSKAQQALGQAE